MRRALMPADRQTIFALADRGVPPVEIIGRTGISRSAVYKALADRRATALDGWPAERIEKLHRIHAAALQVIAEAFGATVQEISATLRNGSPEPARPRKALADPPIARIAEPPMAPPEILPPPEHREEEEAPDEHHPAMESRTGGSASPLQRRSEADVPPPDSLQAEPQVSSAADEAPPPPPAPVVVDVPKGQRIYGLKSMDGKWLTRDGKGFTSVPSEAWSGTAGQARDVRQRLANARYCKAREFD